MMRSIVRYPIACLFVATLAGSAAARQNPALVREQARAERVLATCVGEHVAPGRGYRDMYARSHSERAWLRAWDAGPRDLAARALPEVPRAGHGDVVLACPGGLVHLGPGYRDMHVRAPLHPPPLTVAGDPALLLRGQTHFR